jgi:hypothetical protein
MRGDGLEEGVRFELGMSHVIGLVASLHLDIPGAKKIAAKVLEDVQ